MWFSKPFFVEYIYGQSDTNVVFETFSPFRIVFLDDFPCLTARGSASTRYRPQVDGRARQPRVAILVPVTLFAPKQWL